MKILIVTGASGGHIFPALSFIDAIKKKIDIECTIVALKTKLQQEILSSVNNINIIWINPLFTLLNKFNLSFFSKSSTFLILLFRALFILNKIKPDVVVGCGGFISVPLIFTAHLRGIPTIIHEQNVDFGKANKILFSFVDKIAISFPESKEYVNNGYAQKLVFTGNPLRSDICKIDRIKALNWFNLKDKFTVLVIGGSQGAHKINKIFLESVLFLKDKIDLQVIHLCGREDFKILNAEYLNLGIDFRLYSFLKEINFAYNACNILLSRSGASSISEIASLGLASILIPYPHASRHQEKNAQILSRREATIVIPQIDLTTEYLSNTILKLSSDVSRLEDLAKNAFALAQPDAANLLAEEVMDLAK